jgi:hypothetical protein
MSAKSDGSERRLTVYVRSEPGSSDPQWDQVFAPGERFAAMFIPIIIVHHRSDYDRAEAARQARVPYEQAHCVRLAVDVGTRLHYAVEIVDVNAPEVAQLDVQRVIGTGAVFPVLVRPDGRWIEGVENFTPAKVRKFLT